MDYLLIATMIYLVGVCVAWFDEYHETMRFFDHYQLLSYSYKARHEVSCDNALKYSWLSWFNIWINSGE